MRETRKYKKTCKSCNKYQKPECIKNTLYEHDGYEPCDNYKRAGGRKAKIAEDVQPVATYSTVVKCAEEGCKYYDVKPKSGCARGDDPDNCGHFEFLPTELRSPGKHSEKNLSGIPNMKLEKKKDELEKCVKVDCIYFSKSSRSKDNCSIAGLLNNKCDYKARTMSTIKPIRVINDEKAASEAIKKAIHSKEGEKVINNSLQSVLCGIRDKGNDITLGEILNLLNKYQVEIVLRPLK